MSEQITDLIEEVVHAQDTDDNVLASVLASQDAADIALLLESLPVDERQHTWEQIPQSRRLEVLVEMRVDARETLIADMSREQWLTLLADIDAEDLLELSYNLPSRIIDLALSLMDEKQSEYFADAAQFDDDETGRWINHDMLVLPQNAKVRDAMRLLRREIAPHTDTLFLVNRAGQFAEAVRITEVLRTPDHTPLVDISEDAFSVLQAKEDCVDAAMLLQKSGFSALPVVDEQQKLLGRLDITAASELVNEYYEGQLMASAGMDEEEDLFSPVAKSARKRAIWLGINLLTAFLASAFIGLFEATLQQVVALAVLMPVVASMGGIAGSQTLTLIIRGLALGQVSKANLQALIRKEVGVGAVNGVIWAVVIGAVASFWFGDPRLGLVIGLAILANIICAALSGVLIPVLLEKFDIDPALSGSVILTTVTDIVGFVAFLGLGTMLLL